MENIISEDEQLIISFNGKYGRTEGFRRFVNAEVDFDTFEQSYMVNGQLLLERLYPARMGTYTLWKYSVCKSGEVKGTILADPIFEMSKIVGEVTVLDLLAITEAMHRYKGASFIRPPLHHITDDLLKVRLGMQVPSFVSIEPMLTRVKNKRSNNRRLLKRHSSNKNGLKALSGAFLTANIDRLSEPEIKGPFEQATVLWYGESVHLQYDNFNSAEEFIDFEYAWANFFYRK